MLVDPTGLYGIEIHMTMTSILADLAGFADAPALVMGVDNIRVDWDHDAVALWKEASNLHAQWRLAVAAGDITGNYETADKLLEEGFKVEKEIIYWHFPHDIGATTLPYDNPYISRRVESAIEACDYREFGRQLHALQDSYSHTTDYEGANPRLPVGYFWDHSYGHPWPYGLVGLMSGKADDPFARPDLAEKMAERTYKYMRQYVDSCYCEHRGQFQEKAFLEKQWDNEVKPLVEHFWNRAASDGGQ
ncbi:MAG: hypothetical protein ACYTAN_14250 [Planctomycetota bacterium]|jgi:hypothetical protein